MRIVLLATVSLALLAPAGAAQALSFFGDLAGDRFGESVDGAGDVDADGYDDIVVGASHDFIVACFTHEVTYLRVLSGLDGSVIWNYPIDGQDHRGMIVKGLGDLDADGYADFGDANGPDFCCATTSPAAKAYSGRTGALLHAFFTDWYDLVDRSFDAAGDVNNNGHDDVIIGAPDSGPGFSGGEGIVTLFEGDTGGQILQIMGSASGERLGFSVAGVGDWDGDGRDDIAYSTDPGWSSPSTTVVNAAGTVIFQVLTGGTIDDPGDFDGDGSRDLFLSNGGTGRVYSGADSSVLLTLDSWSQYRVVQDVDGDGRRDFLASEPTAGGNAGAVAVLSGTSGAELLRLRDGDPGDFAGWSIAPGGDVNADGRDDFILGALRESGNAGAAHVYLAPSLPFPTNYCPPAPNSAGPGATLTANGTWSLANNDLRLAAAGCPPNHFGVMFYGPGQTQVPFGDGFLCVAGTVHRLNPPILTDGAGAVVRPVDMTEPPADSGPGQITVGSTWNFQFWFRDVPAMMNFFNLSEGLTVTFCP